MEMDLLNYSIIVPLATLVRVDGDLDLNV